MRISDWSADGCSSDLRESAHRTARLIGVFQPVEEHMVVCGVVPDARAAAMLLEQIGRIGHRFHAARDDQEIGRPSCRESVCQYVSISLVGVSLKQQNKQAPKQTHKQYM